MLYLLPLYITFVFFIALVATYSLLWVAIKTGYQYRGKKVPLWIMPFIIAWLALQAALAFNEFYADSKGLPPRLFLGVLPPLLFIILLFITKAGKKFIYSLPLNTLTYLHSVRILVELVLLWLFFEKAVPQIMTFEGSNFDILAGISAPIVAFLFFNKEKISRKALLIWNFIGLILLLNIVTIAILSLPSPFQQLGLEQPNKAVLYFPFIWLPTFIVPVVLFSHLVAFKQLIRSRRR